MANKSTKPPPLFASRPIPAAEQFVRTGKADTEAPKRRFPVYLSADLFARFAAHCAALDSKWSEEVELALRHWLARQGTK